MQLPTIIVEISYKDKGDIDLAIKDYSKAIELKPDYAVAYNNRGNAYKNKGDIDLAIADYRKALQINPNYKLAQDSLNNALKKKNN
jgi:tetratricopeptide (TPR) repeat protein